LRDGSEGGERESKPMAALAACVRHCCCCCSCVAMGARRLPPGIPEVILDLGCIVPARNERLEERMEQEKSSSSRASEDWIACSRADMVELATTLPAIEGSEPGDVGMEAAWLRSVIWPVDDEELQLRNWKVPELDNESAQFPSELPLERDSLPPLKKIAFWSSCCLASNSSALTKSDRLLGPRNKQSASTR